MSNVVNFNEQLAKWNALKPVYFQRWVWDEIVRKNPMRYSHHFPTYQDKRVILT